jgi:hypothetical protein
MVRRWAGGDGSSHPVLFEPAPAILISFGGGPTHWFTPAQNNVTQQYSKTCAYSNSQDSAVSTVHTGSGVPPSLLSNRDQGLFPRSKAVEA